MPAADLAGGTSFASLAEHKQVTQIYKLVILSVSMVTICLVFITSSIRLLELTGIFCIVLVCLSRLLFSLVTTEMGNIRVIIRKGESIIEA